jgi:ATP-binding cassette subfamily B protein
MQRLAGHEIGSLIARLPPNRRLQLLSLLGVMFCAAIAEVISLGAVVPFLAVLVDPDRISQMPIVARAAHWLGWSTGGDLRWPLTVMFAVTAVLAAAIRFALVYVTARINFGIGHEIASDVYRRALYQPYEVHVARNSSEILAGIGKVDETMWVVFAVLNMISAGIMAVFIVATLVYIDPMLAITTLLGLGCIYAAFSALTQKRLSIDSAVVNKAYSDRAQAIQEGLGGIRDVLLDHSQPLFVRRFDTIDLPLRLAKARISIIDPSPRFAVEALGMVLIAILAFTASMSPGGMAAAVPTLGVLALGVQRLMPLIQKVYQGWVQVTASRRLLQDVVGLLNQPVAEDATIHLQPLPFDREIRLDRVSYRYREHLPLVLQDVSLVIRKGTRVGFIGATGSGKSTAIDLLMGLLQPTMGSITVDGHPLSGASRLAWQRNIAHVPQAIFMADASFAENIAFGVPSDGIDLERVRAAARQAQIADFIEADPLGYAATVGERGVRVSGGQRQRIAIARALYKQASFLVFDEATSALDTDTETIVMQAIAGLGRDLTIVLIAHRLTTLQGCDVIYRLENGRMVNAGSYETMMSALQAERTAGGHRVF